MTRKRAPSSSCGSGPDGSCPPPAGTEFPSLQALIDDYLANYGDRVAAEAGYFGDKRLSIADAVRRAALSLLEDGTIHDHQRLPGKQAMARCAAALAGHEQALAESPTFAALHDRVKLLLHDVRGAGELACYDIAERIGWRIGRAPELVYLHCGTGDGARLLRPGLRGSTVATGALAPELDRLSPAHVENLLCIYKDALASLKRRGLL